MSVQTVVETVKRIFFILKHTLCIMNSDNNDGRFFIFHVRVSEQLYCLSNATGCLIIVRVSGPVYTVPNQLWTHDKTVTA